MNSFVFSSSGQTTFSVKQDSFLNKGDIFDKYTILNSKYIDTSTFPEIVLRFAFKERGFYTFQYLVSITPKDGSISQLSLVENLGNKSQVLMVTKTQSSHFITQTLSIDNLDKSYSWQHKSLLGHTQDIKISNLDIFYSPYE